jgi:AmmeMemoRadiSam system protein B/AmmeMemoRadiSam system protein A
MTAAQPASTAPAPAHPERLLLGDEQRRLVLAAARELLCANVAGHDVRLPDPELGGAASQLVSGAFLSIKRGKHLRACCGGLLERPVPLREALTDAVAHAALEDSRFPPVSPVELAHVDIEVWLLFNPQRLRVCGEERVAAVVTGGKHGLIVRRGQNRGLLLPGVAAEHGWDARKFLEQVCVKAGLHPSVWKDDATALMTFEGESIRGAVFEEAASVYRTPGFLSRDEVAAYADLCRGNITALLAGAMPRYSLAGVPDGTVSGLALTLGLPGFPDRIHVMQVSLRPGLALQATLFQLAQTAAHGLLARGVGEPDFEAAALGLTILYDPAMHGTVREPDLGGVDPAERALLVAERTRSSLVYDPGRTPEELLAEAARQAQVQSRSGAAVFSLQALTTESHVVLATGPQPVPGPDVRPPGVAGRFYPADAAALTRLVDRLLAGERRAEAWPAALVPHAGLTFSGHIAAAVLRRLHIPRTVIVLGPKHTPLGMEWAVAPHHTWSIPGATLASDIELAHELAAAIPGLTLDASAHQQEHAIEVELPFLARLAPQTRVVGIVLGHADLEGCRRFAGGLADVLRRRAERPLLLISSDMNHFATDEENRRLDELALQALEGLDPAEVYRTVRQNQISMCGVLPAVIVLETLRRLGTLQRAERVGYATSGEVTGDRSRVVGYAGMLFG